MENSINRSVLKNNAPQFGVAGYPPNFFSSASGKHREDIFSWLHGLNLDWVELQCTYGVKMKDDQAKLYKEKADKFGVGVSIHGPYYITLASGDPEVVKRSCARILQCVHLAQQIGASRIIFHPGYYPGKTEYDRKVGLTNLINELNGLKHDIPSGVYLYPETAGKHSQLGSLDEILQICEQVDYARPCIDLAHIHGFTGGSLHDETSIAAVFEEIERRFGTAYLQNLHIHMYPVDYDKNGEKKHKSFYDIIDGSQPLLADTDSGRRTYFPHADDFINVIWNKKLKPVIVCEAYNSQDEGALLMKHLYYQKCNA